MVKEYLAVHFKMMSIKHQEHSIPQEDLVDSITICHHSLKFLLNYHHHIQIYLLIKAVHQ